ncbi:hypothetical protein LTR17_024426 [Elasticomyces elasticus]|nr:hypothetical protein LTR17_024426 [Elasticomyces elasticus]
MGEASEQDWQVAIRKKSRDGTQESDQLPTLQTTDDCEAESRAPTSKSTSITSPDVFFSKLPIELRDVVYEFLVAEITSALFNHQAGHPDQHTDTPQSTLTAQSIFLDCALVCRQMHDKLENAWIRIGSWLSDCLDGPSGTFPTDRRNYRIHQGLRHWELKAKLSGTCGAANADDYDYSLAIIFDKKYKSGYVTVWSGFDAQARTTAHLREDDAEYEATQRLVEHIIVETVADRRAQDGSCGLTQDGAAKIFYAFGIKRQDSWELEDDEDSSEEETNDVSSDDSEEDDSEEDDSEEDDSEEDDSEEDDSEKDAEG